tara:strand:+ start:747 stop:911 length:165 start_codon:yes stop_codon:yes gene_type:complete
MPLFKKAKQAEKKKLEVIDFRTDKANTRAMKKARTTMSNLRKRVELNGDFGIGP